MYDYRLIYALMKRSHDEVNEYSARVWKHKYGGKVVYASQPKDNIEAWSKLLDTKYLSNIPGYKSSEGKKRISISGEKER